jgi:catechol 2,3-dioxygenase-like lactoylglutathione lyase family enzyme
VEVLHQDVPGVAPQALRHAPGLVWVGTRTERYEQMVRFYRDVLGMTEIKHVTVSDDKAVKSRAADHGFEFRIFTLGPLALKLVTVQTDPTSTAGAVDSHIGVRYLAFVVDDLDELQGARETAR